MEPFQGWESQALEAALGRGHGDTPGVTFVARLATGPGLPWLSCCSCCRVTAKIWSRESRSEHMREEMAPMDLCRRRARLSRGGQHWAPHGQCGHTAGPRRAHHADGVTGVLQRPAQQLQHDLAVQQPTPGHGTRVMAAPGPAPLLHFSPKVRAKAAKGVRRAQAAPGSSRSAPHPAPQHPWASQALTP